MSRASKPPSAAAGVPWPAEPMLAKPVEELPLPASLPGGCLYEPKWDGYRALAATSASGQAFVRSRRAVDLTGGFPEIAAALAAQLEPGTLLDGELVIWSGDHLDFGALQQRIMHSGHGTALSRAQPASFVVFDVLRLAGRDLSGRPLRTRRRALEQLTGLTPPLQVTPATRDVEVARQWARDYAAAGVGIEGLVIKGLSSPYLPGRRAWLKLRSRSSVEAVVGAVGGRARSPERLLLGLLDEAGDLQLVGSTGLLSAHQQREIAALLEPVGEDHPWPPDIMPAGVAAWGARDRRLPITLVAPTLVVEVEADAAYRYGQFRHIARLLRPRPDLAPDEIERLAPGD